MKILFVEDDRELCKVLKLHLEKAGYETDFCHSGSDALFYILGTYYDLIILDRMLPEMGGLSLLKTIRQKSITTPVIFLTALDQLNDKITGLDAGADDYLTKPFEISELLARIRAVVRRPGHRKEPKLLYCRDLTLNTEKQTLSCCGKTFSLSGTETRLAEILFKNAGQTLPRTYLINSVWGCSSDVNESNLDNYIYFLRKRLRQAGTEVKIKTMHGVGYYLSES